MNLKPGHIISIIISILLVACAMESRMKSSDIEEAVDITKDIKVEDYVDVKPSANQQLISEKLQDFYDLMALQKQHPEFTNEVIEQLRSYTMDSISDFKTDDDAIKIKNIRILSDRIITNDTVQKLKIAYDKIASKTKTTDTIYAIITTKTVVINGESLISNKIRFSKN